MNYLGADGGAGSPRTLWTPYCLGIVLRYERPTAEEYVGIAAIPVAVFLLTTARVKVRGEGPRTAALEQVAE